MLINNILIINFYQDDELIDITVSKLLPGKVSKLFEEVTKRVSSHPFKASIFSKWLKYILKYHSTILITTPKIN